LIDKRCAHIDKRNETAVTLFRKRWEATIYVALHNRGDTTMNKFLNLLDRSANWLMGVLIVAGMPLAAVALATNAL
jgi:hypothetical protein